MLNSNQQKIMDVIRSTMASGDTLSMQSIADAIGVGSPNTVLYHLRKLEEKGFLRRDANGKIVSVISGDSNATFAYLPLLANARCGPPLDQVLDESTAQMVPMPLSLMKRGMNSNLYLIQAVGDSMTPKIDEGDYVVFESINRPQNGDTVVVRTEEGFRIKQFQELDKQYVLKSVNPAYQPLVYEKDQLGETFNIDGVAIGLFKPQENIGWGGLYG